MSDLQATLLEFLVSDLKLDRDGLDADTVLFSSNLLDSFALMDVIAFLEKTAEVRVRAGDVSLSNLDTVARMVRFVEGRKP